MQLTNNCLLVGISLLVVMSAFGCKRITGKSGEKYIQRELESKELIGSWRASSLTIKKLSQEGFKDYLDENMHSLLLSEDGICSISTFNYLTYLMETNEELNYIRNKSGNWNIGTSNAYIYHRLENVPSVDIQIETQKNGINHTISISFYIAEDKNGIYLWRFIGDPDYNNYYTLRRI